MLTGERIEYVGILLSETSVPIGWPEWLTQFYPPFLSLHASIVYMQSQSYAVQQIYRNNFPCTPFSTVPCLSLAETFALILLPSAVCNKRFLICIQYCVFFLRSLPCKTLDSSFFKMYLYIHSLLSKHERYLACFTAVSFIFNTQWNLRLMIMDYVVKLLYILRIKCEVLILT